MDSVEIRMNETKISLFLGTYGLDSFKLQDLGDLTKPIPRTDLANTIQRVADREDVPVQKITVSLVSCDGYVIQNWAISDYGDWKKLGPRHQLLSEVADAIAKERTNQENDF